MFLRHGWIENSFQLLRVTKSFQNQRMLTSDTKFRLSINSYESCSVDQPSLRWYWSLGDLWLIPIDLSYKKRVRIDTSEFETVLRLVTTVPHSRNRDARYSTDISARYPRFSPDDRIPISRHRRLCLAWTRPAYLYLRIFIVNRFLGHEIRTCAGCVQ